MALRYPGYNAVQVTESPLAQFLPALEQGRAKRADDLAGQAYARFATNGQPQPRQQTALESLMSFGRQPEQAPAPQGNDMMMQSFANANAAQDPALTDYFANARRAESGGNDAAANPNSSALGRYQFLEGTWNGLMQQYPELGLTANGRTDPAQQERAMAQFTADNARALGNAGLPVNPGNLYAAHFLGAGGATNVLGQDPSAPLSAYVSPEVMAANPHLNGMSVGDFAAWAGSKGGGSGGGYQAPMRNEGAVSGAQPFNMPDEETIRAMLASDEYRPVAIGMINAAQQQQMSQGRFVTEQGPDGSVWQRDTLTGERSVLQGATKASDTPSSVREYQFAQSQGFQGTYQDWQQANKAGTTVNVNTGDQDSALSKSLSTKEGEAWSGYKDSAAVSASNAQDFEILGELLTLAPQGPITGRLANMFQGVNSAGDAVNSIVKRIAPTLRAPGSGATSDIEYDGMLRSLPSLVNAPEANAMILAIMQAKAQINMERGRIVTAYQNDEMTIAEARAEMDELNKQSIMTPEMRRALIGLGSDGETGTPPPAVGEIVDGYRYTGGDPASPTSWTKVN